MKYRQYYTVQQKIKIIKKCETQGLKKVYTDYGVHLQKLKN